MFLPFQCLLFTDCFPCISGISYFFPNNIPFPLSDVFHDVYMRLQTLGSVLVVSDVIFFYFLAHFYKFPDIQYLNYLEIQICRNIIVMKSYSAADINE